MAQNLNRRFLKCVSEVEAHLSGPKGFKDRAYDMVSDGSLSASQARELDWMWDLRNLLSHNSVDGSEVAEVLPASVRAAERIRNRLTGRVPSVKGLLSNVAMANPKDSVAAKAEFMASNDYSCLPVRVEGRVVGAIDADMILHWVASGLHESGLLEDTTVGDIRNRFPQPRLAFMRSDSAQREVVAAFKASLAKRGPLGAVLLTTDGSDTGPVKGIVTPWDVASLHS